MEVEKLNLIKKVFNFNIADSFRNKQSNKSYNINRKFYLSFLASKTILQEITESGSRAEQSDINTCSNFFCS